MRRAGLDYWLHLHLTEHATPEAFLEWLGERQPWLVTKRGEIRFDHAPYHDGDVLLFGNEVTGLPREWHERWAARRVVVPQPGPVRSYNLANCVAIVLATAAVRISP